MHQASRLVLPAGALPGYRPVAPRRGTLRLSADQLHVSTRTELLARGYTEWGLRAAVRDGILRRVARGWFATASAAPEVTAPLAAGHRLTCVDAARLHGLWTPRDDFADGGRLHVYRYDDARPTPRRMVGHRAGSRTWPEPDAVASLPLALEHALRCRSGEVAAVLLESAMQRRLLTPSQVQQMLDAAPCAVRDRIGTLSTASDSGSETRVVRWLRRRGFRVEQQVFIEGVGFVDAYAGGLFLEIDGRAYHSSAEAFSRDRRHGLVTCRSGLQVLRLSYGQVWEDWDRTREDILATIAEVGAFGRRKVTRMLAGQG